MNKKTHVYFISFFIMYMQLYFPPCLCQHRPGRGKVKLYQMKNGIDDMDFLKHRIQQIGTTYFEAFYWNIYLRANLLFLKNAQLKVKIKSTQAGSSCTWMYLLYGVYFLRVDLGRRSKVNEAICFVRDTEMRSDEHIKTSMHLYSMLIALLYINRYILVYLYAHCTSTEKYQQ